MRPALLLFISLTLSASTLVKNGTSNWSICVAADAPASDRRAAEELQRYVGEMSGARLQTKCGGGRLVFVGDSPALRRAMPGFAAMKFGAEEFVLKTQGKHLVLAGGKPRGALYAVYTFLDRLGVRWFTSEVTRVPKRSTIQIDRLDVREKPAFEYREVFFTEAFERDWAARNRTNGNSSKLDESTGGKVEYFPFVHSFYQLVPPQKHFAAHPEYFSLIDGKRRIERGQLCLTNPDVPKIAVAQVREWIREHPTAKILSVSQNDWEGWCECDRCLRVEQEEGGRHSGPVLRFVNAVAAEIEKTNPDKLIDTLAYWYTEDPPSTVRPRANVRIRLCPIGVCESHPYEQCPRSAYFVKNLKAWSRITNQLYIWHYNTNFTHYLSPFPDFDELAADISLYRRSGVVGLFLQGAYAAGGGGENAELRSYVMARQLWRPTGSVAGDVKEFLDGVYGRAAGPMREYLDRLHKEGQHIWIFNLPDFSPSFLDEGGALLRRALDAANDDSIRRRVERASLPIEYVRLVQAREYCVKGGVYSPDDLAEWKVRFHEFIAKLRTFGIQSIREGRTLAETDRQADALRGYSVLPLENEHWRVSVVPDLGGRIVQMISKKAGQDVLRRVRAGEDPGGGQVVQAYPDFPLRAWDASWRALSATAVDAQLEGKCENGLVLDRRIRLDGDTVVTEVTARNASGGELEVVLQSRADLEPGDIDAARLRYRSAGGALVDRLVLNPGEIPNGSETLSGGKLPVGEWASGAVTNRFSPELVERVTSNWTAKGGPRVTLGVWSKKRTLRPGETLSLRSDYR